jgi:hypothetical protein
VSCLALLCGLDGCRRGASGRGLSALCARAGPRPSGPRAGFFDRSASRGAGSSAPPLVCAPLAPCWRRVTAAVAIMVGRHRCLGCARCLLSAAPAIACLACASCPLVGPGSAAPCAPVPLGLLRLALGFPPCLPWGLGRARLAAVPPWLAPRLVCLASAPWAAAVTCGAGRRERGTLRRRLACLACAFCPRVGPGSAAPCAPVPFGLLRLALGCPPRPPWGPGRARLVAVPVCLASAPWAAAVTGGAGRRERGSLRRRLPVPPSLSRPPALGVCARGDARTLCIPVRVARGGSARLGCAWGCACGVCV